MSLVRIRISALVPLLLSLVLLVLTACSSAPAVANKPEHYGVFIKTDTKLVETAQYRGYPSTTQPFLWLPLRSQHLSSGCRTSF